MNKDKIIICHDIKGQAHEHKLSELEFRPAVYGILIENNKVLLSKQYGDGYDFPGGGVDIDETIDQALTREFLEETGLRVEKDKLVDIFDTYFHSLRYDRPWHSIQMFYTCKKLGGELSIEGLEDYEKKYIEMPEWIEVSKVDELKFYNQVDSPGLIKKAANL